MNLDTAMGWQVFHPGDRVARVDRPLLMGKVRWVVEPELTFLEAMIVFVDWDDGNTSNSASFALRKLSALESLAEAAE